MENKRMTRNEAIKKAKELTETTGNIHHAVRESGDWYQESGWHVENTKGETVEVE